ncbi:DUF4192 family protein [Streptomyces sp. AC495_CC817]|uniref:DUF4192 family protein n=1 Tax=Streptomyces sp. AC495_CC817 TaxID=2823900 RepID=UPI001C27C1E2|nr:DUF4192 family protein [Streptomyces sp. AC495_CC817]
MTTILHATDSAGFLGIVPSLAGFTPRRSIVLLPFRGRRTYGAMRIDLPGPDADPVDFAEGAISLAVRVESTDAVAVVVYTDDGPVHTRDGLVLPFDVHVDALLGCAGDAGLRIVDALCVTSDGWSSYLDDDPALAPTSTIPAPEQVPGLGDVSGDQFDGTALPHVDLATTERVGRILRALEEATRRTDLEPTGEEDPSVLAAMVLLGEPPELFESLLERRAELPPHAMAALLWCLARPVLRDVAIAQWATDLAGGRRALDEQMHFARRGHGLPDDLGELFIGRGAGPDPDRLRIALSAARLAAAHAPRPARVGALTIAAWLSWALGRSTHAAYYLDLVRDIDPEYGLARLLDTLIGAAALPEWAFRRGADGR